MNATLRASPFLYTVGLPGVGPYASLSCASEEPPMLSCVARLKAVLEPDAARAPSKVPDSACTPR